MKTTHGSSIKRHKAGVGKEIGGRVYVHRNYAEDVIPADVLREAERIMNENLPGFKYNCVVYDKRKGVVGFQEAPDFDTAREPVVGRMVNVYPATGKVDPVRSHKQIWHHKWLWVKDNYTGFDVEESKEWSRRWLAVLPEPANGSNQENWLRQLERFGLRR